MANPFLTPIRKKPSTNTGNVFTAPVQATSTRNVNFRFGGQYLQADDPQELVKEERGYGSFETKKGFQRGHIFPVSLGGTSNDANLRYEPLNEALYRDNVVRYAASQVRSGKIPLAQARVMVLNWENTDIPGQKAWSKKFGGAQNMFSNFLKSVPEALAEVGQSITRSIGSVGVSLSKPLTGEEEVTPKNKFMKSLFGDEPIKSLEDRVAGAEISLQTNPTSKKLGLDKYALPLAFGGVIGDATLNFTGFGGESQFIKQLAKTTDVAAIKGLLKQAKFADDVAESFIGQLAKTTDVKETKVLVDAMRGGQGIKFVDEADQLLKSEDPLLTEARKYKSAEEFVDNVLQPFLATDSGKEYAKYGWRLETRRVDDLLQTDFFEPAELKYQSQKDLQKLLKNPTTRVQVPPVTIEKNGQIIDGNHRLEAYRKLGIKQVPVLVHDVATPAGRVSNLPDIWKKAQGEATLLRTKVEPVVKMSSSGNIYIKYGNEAISLPKTIQNDIYEAGQSGTISSERRLKANTVLNRKGLELDATGKLRPVDLLLKEKRVIEVPPKTTPKSVQPVGVGASATAKADQALQSLPAPVRSKVSSLIDIVARRQTEVKKKVNILDYLRTPDRVLEKIGFARESKMVREGYERYVKELPKNIDRVTAWSKRVPKESAKTIFQYLDGEDVKLSPSELEVAGEIKTWLAEWATRLKLPKDKTITNYITHIFDKELVAKEFDEDLAKIITDRIPGSVYDPFLLSRLGKKGYKQDVWQALDAYVKRATRKVNMDDALAAIQEKAGTTLDMSNIESSQFKYIQRYVSGVNMRPTELDNIIDNGIKSAVGYRFGQRPVTHLTKLLRQLTYRGMLGVNPGSALRNLSQGINTYAVLGEKYTAIGYAKLLSPNALREAAEEGVFAPGFIQDRNLSSTKKAMEKIDKGLFAFFELAERINRGAAYFGAKSQALAKGKSPQEAIDYAKSVVRKTQFSFGSIDTPVGLQSDIAKTAFQFQNFTLKQSEFLIEMAKDKNFIGLLRYALAGMTFVYTIGQAFGMEPEDLVPSFRLGAPPSLKLPVEVTKAALNTPDRYGQPRDLKKKATDVANSSVGLIPGGTQIKKSLQGLKAYRAGKDVTPSGRTRFEVPQDLEHFLQSILFGKYSTPEGQEYIEGLNKPKATTTEKASGTTNPFLK